MSNYTTELRNLVLANFDIGLTNYPIFSEGYRETLNTKIINHYYFHEIGVESAERFKHYLSATMNEIMLYYNKLYQSELLSINPLLSFQRTSNITKDIDSNSNKTATNTANSTGSNTTTLNGSEHQDTTLTSERDAKDKDIFSDTPKSLLTDDDLETNYYATDARIKTDTENLSSTEGISKTDSSTNVSSLTTGTTINDHATDVSTVNETNVITENGYEVPLSELVVKYRETFINIDLMIINDLKDLFMLIY